MAYFEKNIHAGEPTIKSIDHLMDAVSAVVSNTCFSLENEQTRKSDATFCRSLYTLIGICEATLASFPEEARDEALGFATEYFSGEYARKRKEAAGKALMSAIAEIFK